MAAMAGKGLRRVALPAEDPARSAAEALLAVAGGPAELASHILLVAHGGLQNSLGAALHRLAGGACTLPRVLTLEQWLARQPVPPVTLGTAQLVAELQRQIAARPWLANADHWAMAAELATLFEELGRHLIGSGGEFPQTEDALAGLLASAYQTRESSLLRFDARLVHELWFACEGQPRWGLSTWQRDALAMAHLLKAPDGPLWVFDHETCPPQAQAFFERYAEHRPTVLFRLDAGAASSHAAATSARAAWVRECLEPGPLALRERAVAWQARQPRAPQGIRHHRVLGREGEARHACDTLCEWLAEGLERIAVVATDRALARRLRALLERRGVLAEDKAGWLLSTTRVGAAVRDLLRLQRRATPALLRACIDSPLVTATGQDVLREALGRALDRQPPGARLDWQALAQAASDAPAALAWLERLQQTFSAIGQRSRPLADWIGALLDALGGLAPDLAVDPAAAQLLAHLQQSRVALARHLAPSSAAEFADWLDWSLGETLFRDDSVCSPVLLTHPGALRGLTFDAVLVVGADAAHLPAAGGKPRILRDAARSELGLPDASARRVRAMDDWCLLMGSAPRIEITWQQLDDKGEPNPASPFVLLMQAFHQLAWGVPLPAAPAFDQPEPDSPGSLQPIEFAPGLVPAELSPTGYQALLDCPYRWFVRDGLRLRAPEEVEEGTEPSDFGEAVHRVLRLLHEREPTLSGLDRDGALATLEAVTQEVFAPLLTRDFGASAWLQRWLQVAPAFLDWQREREAAGWRIEVSACEREVTGALAVDGGHSVRLRGKPDRVDAASTPATNAVVTGADAIPGLRAAARSGETDAGRRAIIDYKTGSRVRLEAFPKDPTEDAQLVLYAQMVDGVDEVAYLPLGSDALEKGGSLLAIGVAGGTLQESVDGHVSRLAETFARLEAGATLPAMGDAKACKYCDARGLCRKDHRAGAS